MTEKQLIELLGKWGAAIRDAILVGIRDVRDNARLTEIIRMIEQSNVEGALRALGYDPAVFNTYQVRLVQAFEQGGMLLMMSQPRYTADATGVQTMLRFNARSLEAERWLREQSSTLITNIGEDMREAVRSTLDEGMREGRNPRSVALDLVGRYDRTTGHREGGVVGLGEREQFWSRSVRQKLLTLDASYFDMSLRDKRFDATVRAAIESGTPLPAETVQRLTDRYRARALQFRGETIGRTEALGALNRSQYEATRQALEQSGLPPAAAHKVWKSAKDSRVRHSHRAMHNQRVGIDEPFVSPDTGARLMHPHDSSLGAPAREIIDCYAPWTKISVSNLASVIRRDYVGQLVNISIGVGYDLSVTPNHPILTERGWVAAGDIVKGDKLIYRFFGNGVLLMKPDERDILPTVEQLYRSYDVTCENERIGREVVNFHGEIPEHDVDVISVPRKLRNGIETFGSEFLAQFSLTDTDIALGLLFFNRALNVLTVVTRAHSDVCGPCSSGPFFTGHFSSRESVSFADVGSFQTQIGNARINHRSAATDFFRDRIDSITFIQKVLNSIVMFGTKLFVSLRGTLASRSLNARSSDGSVGEMVSHSDPFGGLPDGQTFLIGGEDGATEAFGVFPVTKISKSHYRGPVYNVESDNGLVLAEGIVSHNCRCRVDFDIDYGYGVA